MDAVVRIAAVDPVETRTGTIRYVVKDGDGNEYTTFRESIGQRAQELERESDPHEAVPPDELYDKLKPFKERVAEDIRDS
jgi:hypothetical protein